jgi:hypothetical protein
MHRHERDGLHVRDHSSRLFLRESGNTEKSEQGALEAEFAACRLIPFVKRMCAAAGAACADGDGVDAVGERHVGVGGGALDARLGSDVFIGGSQCGE